MTLQRYPILEGEFGTGPNLRDRRLLGPTRTERPTFTLTEPLDGVTLRMRWAWQQTAAQWVTDLSRTDGSLIIQGLALVRSGCSLWRIVETRAGMPPGQLWIAWGDQTPRTPGRSDFTGDASVYYRPDALRGAVDGTDRALF